MREILQVQIGQCGINVGQEFWKGICKEHEIDVNGEYHGTEDSQIENIHTYFNSTCQGTFNKHLLAFS